MASKKPKPLDPAAELRELYSVLEARLAMAEGSGAAALALQMRQILKDLADVSTTGGDFVDELAARRKPKAGPASPPARRRKSGQGS